MSKTKFINVKQDFASTNLTVKESLVLSYLASLTKKEYCYASTEHLEEACGIKRRTIFSILNSLEEKKLIIREVFPEVPPKVVYSLSPTGERLKEALDCMYKWGVSYVEEHGEVTEKTKECEY